DLLLGERREVAEVDLAGGRDERIEAAGLLEQLADRAGVLDVDLMIPALAADLDDFVAVPEGLDDGLADSARGTDDDDLHVRVLPDAAVGWRTTMGSPPRRAGMRHDTPGRDLSICRSGSKIVDGPHAQRQRGSAPWTWGRPD